MSYIDQLAKKDKSGKTSNIIDKGKKGEVGYVWSESTKAAVQGPSYFDPSVHGKKGQKDPREAKGGEFDFSHTKLNINDFSSGKAPAESSGGPQYIFKRPEGSDMSQNNAGESAALNKRYELIKKKLISEQNAQNQMQNEGMQRNLARTGNLNSGSGLKLNQQMSEAQLKQNESIGESVEAEKAGAQLQMEEAQKNRAFATSERLGSQEFASGERAAGEKFARGERLSSQGFSKQLFDADMKFKTKAANIQQNQFGQQMKMAMEQFKLDEKVSMFNMDMAEKMWNKKDMMEFFGNMHGYSPRDGSTSWGNSPWSGGGGGGGGGGGSSMFTPPGGGGGGGGGGPTVICTHYFDIGWTSKEVYDANQAYGKTNIDRETKANYLAWARYAVVAMRAYPVLNTLLWPIFYNWIYYMAWVKGAVEKEPLFGKFIFNTTGIKFSNLVGPVIRMFNRKLVRM